MKIFPVHQTLQLWSDFWSTCTCEALVTFFASTQSFSSAHWPNTTTIVTLHNLVRHNLQNTTEKRIHCRKMSAGEERLFRDRKKCTYFMTSLAVLTIARLQSAMRATNCILTKSANLWTLFSAAVFGFLPKNVGSYVLRSFMSKSNVKKRKNESFWR